jgi:hypothetical protein
VHRVLRIHNRFLRNRFEEKVEMYLDQSKPGYKKNFEYLFCGADPDMPEEFYSILEKGCRPVRETAESNSSPFPGLYNSVLTADLYRINTFLNSQKGNTDLTVEHQKYLKRINTGKILVCKVIIVQPQQDPVNPHFDAKKKVSEIFRTQPIAKPLLDNPEIIVSYRDKIGDDSSKHRLWFIHDHTLILPEYLIYFNYETKEETQSIQSCYIGNTLLTLNSPGLSFHQPAEDKQGDSKVDHSFRQRVNEIKAKYSEYKMAGTLLVHPSQRVSKCAVSQLRRILQVRIGEPQDRYTQLFHFLREPNN